MLIAMAPALDQDWAEHEQLLVCKHMRRYGISVPQSTCEPGDCSLLISACTLPLQV